MSKISCDAQITIEGYYLEFGGDSQRKIYLKQDMYEHFIPYIYTGIGEIADSKEETELTHEEWAIAISSIMAIKRKSIGGKMCSFIESMGGTEEVIKSRKTIFWQLLDN